jgi:16S rRNA (cytosine1402-N4)-methyltransferase
VSEKEVKYHIPVLYEECLEGLRVNPSGVYVDATFGGGGHSRGILERLGSEGRLFGFDQDADAALQAIADERFTFVQGNFRYLSNFMRYHGVKRIDGLLADLGLSSHHLDEKTRGFSFRSEGALDMRMNRRAELTAAKALNGYPEEALARMFFDCGELKNAQRIAAAVVRARADRPFRTIPDLLETLLPFAPKGKENRFLAQAFQACRMEVNRETEALCALLEQSPDLLSGGGRLVVVTYHSLEDRLVKHFMKAGNVQGVVARDFYGNTYAPLRPVGRMTRPSVAEVEANPRARSAKLRVAEREPQDREDDGERAYDR